MLAKYEELGRLNKDDIKGFKIIKQEAFVSAGLTEDEMIKVLTRTVSEGLRNGKVMTDIITEIERNLTDEYKKYSTTVARTSASDFYNTGRMNLFNGNQVSPFIEAYQYTAIIDQATTEFCNSHDGQIIQKGSPELSTVNPPNHYNCRSLLVPVFLGESQDPDSFYYNYEKNKKMPAWGSRKNGNGISFDISKPSVRLPTKGFGG